MRYNWTTLRVEHMITDLRTRIWTNLDQFGQEVAGALRHRYANRWETLDASPAAHERALECADGACVLGFQSQLLEASVPNEYVAQFVANDPRRRVGIAGIDPMFPGALQTLDDAVHLGLAGVTISPAAQGFHPAHSAAMRIYERCADLGLPVIVASDIPLTSSAILEFARPAAFDEVARSLPELRLVIGNFGHPWSSETIALIAKHPHVYTDVAGIVGRPWDLYNAILTAASCDVMDKVLFGSGFPFESPVHAIEAIYSINTYSQGTQLASIPRAQIRSIVERNSLEVLGIDSEIGRPERIPEPDGETVPEAAELVNTVAAGDTTHEHDNA